MLGVRIGHLVIAKHNGERIIVRHLEHDDWLVIVPAAWGDAWIGHARDINDAVEEASMPTQPPAETAA